MKNFEKKSNHNNVRANSEESDPEIHFSNLFDQDEDESGERADLATGNPIDNSTYTGLEELSVREPSDTSEDILGNLDDEEDEATKWLREHGDKGR